MDMERVDLLRELKKHMDNVFIFETHYKNHPETEYLQGMLRNAKRISDLLEDYRSKLLDDHYKLK